MEEFEGDFPAFIDKAIELAGVLVPETSILVVEEARKALHDRPDLVSRWKEAWQRYMQECEQIGLELAPIINERIEEANRG